MIYNVPFEYTTLITLLTLLKYEVKRNISLVNLVASRNVLLDVALDDYYSKNVEMYGFDDWKGKVFFEKIDVKKELFLFLDKYKNIISYENDELILNKSVKVEKLEELIDKFDINERIFCASKSEKFFNSLNLEKIPKMVKSFSKLEISIENAYLNYMNSEGSKKTENDLKLKLFERYIFINNLSLLNNSAKDALANYARVISFEDDNYEYKTFPFDEEHYNNSEYFDDDYELFTIYYIKNINEFMKRYGKNSMLNLVKYRLLYVIDNPDLMLYKEENFNKVLELVEPIKQVNIDNFNENEDMLLKPLNCYKEEAEYFIISCFESKFDKYTIKKLLFIATYYELVCDEDIEDLLEKYKDNMNYEFYKSVIYNKGMGYNKNIRKN